MIYAKIRKGEYAHLYLCDRRKNVTCRKDGCTYFWWEDDTYEIGSFARFKRYCFMTFNKEYALKRIRKIYKWHNERRKRLV